MIFVTSGRSESAYVSKYASPKSDHYGSRHKAIVEDLGASRWTIWRAAGSDITDFPKPTKVGR